MLISVVIPIYKVERYLRECVDSVLCQTYRDIEVILVDDGSPDGSPAICDEYAQKDARVKVIHKTNGGLSDARNAGIDVASGEYIVCLDSDDFWIGTDALAQAAKVLISHPDILFFDRITYCTNGKTIHPRGMQLSSINGMSRVEALTTLMQGGKFIVSACNKFVKTSLLKEHHVSFKKGIVSEDIDWTYQMMPFVQTMCGIDIPFYGYRRRDDSITNTIGRKNLEDLLWIIEKWSSELEQKESNPKVRYQLMGYLNYQRFIAMGLLPKVSKEEQAPLKERLDCLEWLKVYDINRKTHLAKIANQFGADWMLSAYIRLKNNGWRIFG